MRGIYDVAGTVMLAAVAVVVAMVVWTAASFILAFPVEVLADYLAHAYGMPDPTYWHCLAFMLLARLVIPTASTSKAD